MVEKILNNTTPYGKIRASHEGSLHSSTLNRAEYFVHQVFNFVIVGKKKMCLFRSRVY